jgi:hypothetical protein
MIHFRKVITLIQPTDLPIQGPASSNPSATKFHLVQINPSLSLAARYIGYRPKITQCSESRAETRPGNQLISYAVSSQYKAWPVSASPNAGVVASNPTRGMGVFVRSFCVCVVLRVGSGLAMGWSPSREPCRLCIGSRNALQRGLKP